MMGRRDDSIFALMLLWWNLLSTFLKVHHEDRYDPLFPKDVYLLRLVFYGLARDRLCNEDFNARWYLD